MDSSVTKMSKVYDMTNLDLQNLPDSKCAIIPLGSLEQHGNHLPVSTDSIIAEFLAENVAKRIHAISLPVMTFGISFEHEPMFNISLSHNTFSLVIKEMCISLLKFGIKDIIILNSHHGNMGALHYVAQDVTNYFFSNSSDDIKNYGRLENLNEYLKKDNGINFINYWHLMEKFDHAGEIETSIILAIKPDLVKLDRVIHEPVKYFDVDTIENEMKTSKELKVAYSSVMNIPGSFRKITGSGIWGDPIKGSPEKGKRLLEDLIVKIEKTIDDFKRVKEDN